MRSHIRACLLCGIDIETNLRGRLGWVRSKWDGGEGMGGLKKSFPRGEVEVRKTGER